MCDTHTLSFKGKTIISQCKECNIINIWHDNLLLCFSPPQFKAFKDFTAELDQAERSYSFPDGEERLILCTPNRDINFAFTMDEWVNFNDAMDEALYMQEVYQLIKQ
ncbi:DUF6686 family protein [Mucilaginibacter myungsuensis]|uniref:Uncharacterized protein n=1 Tax=Mucilaginibacter myungsuensis TaxID=649104 RepID=A0A929KXN0_9SPHI|nr:DUF6686 family protein [Mucilaginibacter myungsuensis]MBE9661823.1 hypothetical protein [Mucilaginibacter myungsuensis]MDN3599743.1 hypothetical protein [Mucilaginibacter myungsuensis]